MAARLVQYWDNSGDLTQVGAMVHDPAPIDFTPIPDDGDDAMFGQAPVPEPIWTTNELVLLMFIGGMVLCAILGIVGGFLYARRERLLTHAERMKALELGRAFPGDEEKGADAPQAKAPSGPKSYADKCFSTTSKASFWGFVFALCAAGTPHGGLANGVAIAIAVATGLIGVTGLLCGSYLAVHAPLASSSTRVDPYAKPSFAQQEV